MLAILPADKPTLAMGDLIMPSTIQKLEDSGLKFLLEFHHGHIKSALINLNLIQYMPEIKSELFNEETINEEIEYHEAAYHEVIQEMKRRVIP